MSERLKTEGQDGRRGAPDPGRLLNEAVQHHRAGHLRDAAGLYNKVLTLQPGNPDALHLLGVVAHQSGDSARAVDLISRAIAIVGDRPNYYSNLGVALAASGRPEDAIPQYRKAASIAPDDPQTLCNLANAFHLLRRHEEAVEAYRATLSLAPGHIMALTNLGISLCELDRREEAISVWRKGLALAPNDPDLRRNLGIALQELGRFEEALPHCRKAVAGAPDNSDAHINLGKALQSLNRHEEAVQCFETALALVPDDDAALNNLGNSLLDLRQAERAIDCFRRAIAAAPENGGYHNNLGNALHRLRRQEEALASFEAALARDPLHANALSQAVLLKRQMCDWGGIGDMENTMIGLVREEQTPILPFSFLVVADDPALQRSCAVRYQASRKRAPPGSASLPARAKDKKLRVGYVANTFRIHPVSFLIAELPELHDRSRFEICAFSHGRDDQSPLRRRLENGFDEFYDVEGESDEEICRKIAAAGIDILVDLDGLTDGNRLQVLARRPAPVQAHFLGYPGTLGCDFIDYLFVDDFIVPPDKAAHYVENLIYLPNSFQVNDRGRGIAENVPVRAACGLPADGFVFCCFNTHYKITPGLFDIWTRLLRDLPGSVLWLSERTAAVHRNLRDEADRRGVDPARLIFAPRCDDLADHLARQRLADLFLDTLPYNAHTTASDALWAGLPVLTCAGSGFASRVAGSLLHAVGLPELVADSLADYEALARRLATTPDYLAALRSRLQGNRDKAPLFDSDLFRCHFEAALAQIWAIRQDGAPPRSFPVAPIRG